MTPFLIFATLAITFMLWIAQQPGQADLFAALAQELGWEAQPCGLRGPGVEMEVSIEGAGRSRRDVLNWSLDLGAPASLTLYREGAASGRAEQRGEHELELNDEDFDDLLWVAAAEPAEAREFLSPARRALLLQTFWELSEARLEGGKLHGKVPFSASRTRLTARRLASLQREDAGPLAAPPGWVNRQQRRTQALRALGWGLVLAVPGAVGLILRAGHGWQVSCAAALALGLALLGGCPGLLQGGPAVRGWLSFTLRASEVASLGVLACGAWWGGAGGFAIGVLQFVVVGWGAESWIASLRRLRLS